MSTYTEQDCLDRIGQMKTWRENAGVALENKGAIQDSSATKLADMPALIRAIDTEPPYAYFEEGEFKSVNPNGNTAYQFDVHVKSNTSWSVNAVNMGSSGSGQTFSGTGDQTLTLTCSNARPYSTTFYRVVIYPSGTDDDTFLWVQRYRTTS